MAKLTKPATAETTAQPNAGQPENAVATSAPAAAETVPFTTAGVADSTPSKPKVAGGQNVFVQRREAMTKFIEEHKPFTYDAEATAKRVQEPFTCICQSKGKNAHVVRDKNGAEVLVGSNCLAQLGVEVPAKERKPRSAPPGADKSKRLEEELKKYAAPFNFLRKQTGTFTCICGGHGENQIVISDGNGVEFSVGETCAKKIPGVVLPKVEKAAKAKGGVAGLKSATATQEKPEFAEVG